MSRLLCRLSFVACLAGAAFAQDAESLRGLVQAKRLAPYVPSPMSVVDQMLDIASLKPGETHYDVGCGDGRLLVSAVQKYRAKSIGIEIVPSIAQTARENLRKNNMQELASVVQADVLDVDLKPADVVTIYFPTDSNRLLQPKLERELKPGARVVSYDFSFPNWKPIRTERVMLYRHKHTIYLYRMPPDKQ